MSSSGNGIGLKLKGWLFESVTHIVAIKLIYSPCNNPYSDDVVSHLDFEFMMACVFVSSESLKGTKIRRFDRMIYCHIIYVLIF